jgi:hypothetical protein
MTITYYLFLDKEFCIRNVFETLRMDILEPGIVYTEIKEQGPILPPFIVIESIYKDGYLLEKVREELEDIGYDKSFKILKPLTLEMFLI